MGAKLAKLVDKLSGTRVLVLGDVMLDHYVWGSVERISAEAPVPVMLAERETEIPGGAANVAVNIAALGGKPVLLGTIGDDERGLRLRDIIGNENIEAHFAVSDRPTTAKVRFLARGQQLLRTDWEDDSPLDNECEENLSELLSTYLEDIDVVVVSDYAKGVVTRKLIKILLDSGKKVVVDPRPTQRHLYQGLYLMTPNHKEAALIADTDAREQPPAEAARTIAAEYTKNVLVTCGAHGMYLHTEEGKTESIPVRPRTVYDVTGAGDTVVATIAMALAARLPLHDAAVLANHAAGVVIGKVGTATVSSDELRADLMDEEPDQNNI